MKNELTVDERFKVAISLRNEGKFKEAAHELLAIIETNSDHPKLSGMISVLAGIYRDMNQDDVAKDYFKQATELNEKSELASLGLYLSLVKLGEYNEAIAELKRYLDKYPADRYKVTLTELLGDLEIGYVSDFKETIVELARKNGVNLGVG